MERKPNEITTTKIQPTGEDEKRGFLQGLEDDLDRLAAKIAELRIQASASRDEARQRYEVVLADLEADLDGLKKKVAEAASSSARAWNDLEARLTRGWNRLKRTVTDAAATLGSDA